MKKKSSVFGQITRNTINQRCLCATHCSQINLSKGKCVVLMNNWLFEPMTTFDFLITSCDK